MSIQEFEYAVKESEKQITKEDLYWHNLGERHYLKCKLFDNFKVKSSLTLEIVCGV